MPCAPPRSLQPHCSASPPPSARLKSESWRTWLSSTAMIFSPPVHRSSTSSSKDASTKMDSHMQLTIRHARAAAITLAAGVLAMPGARLGAQDVAIRNATIITIANGDIPNGNIVVRGGKITAVGANAAIPAGVRTIDGTGKFVMPGIIDAHSHAALEGGINEGAESVTPEVIVQLRNDDPIVPVALAGGVTAAHLMHGSANTIGGQGRVIKMRWGVPAESMYFKGAHRLVKFALGENVTRASSDAAPEDRRFPMSRMGVEHTLRFWFTRAKDYDREWAEYRAAVRSNPNAIMPRRDLRLEALSDIMKGDLKVHAHSYRGD